MSQAKFDLSGASRADLPDSTQLLERYYPEMRWRLLSLAADLDRIERAAGGTALVNADPRLTTFREGIQLLLKGGGSRAESLQSLLSDKTPPPGRS